MIYSDTIKDNFPELIKQLKISQILQEYPELVMDTNKIKQRLRYRPNLYYPLDERVIVRLVEVNNDIEYWHRQIGNKFRLTCNSYSVGGMGLVSQTAGCITMHEFDSKTLVFEVIALPIDTKKTELFRLNVK